MPALSQVPILAEDLGVITIDVVQLRCVLLLGAWPEKHSRHKECPNHPRKVFSMYPKRVQGSPLIPTPCREAIPAPGMVVLQFAWGGGPSNVHLPHMHYDNCYCYPGTHDNETAVGWFKGRCG